jgi:hypothetical protein
VSGIRKLPFFVFAGDGCARHGPGETVPSANAPLSGRPDKAGFFTLQSVYEKGSAAIPRRDLLCSALALGDAPYQFRKIQACPKDSPVLPRQPHCAVAWHSVLAGREPAPFETSRIHHAHRRGGHLLPRQA